MNPMELVPSDHTPFTFERNMERLGRCILLKLNLAKCEAAILATTRSEIPPDLKLQRLAYLHAVNLKFQIQHTDAHRCFPFSRN